MQHGIGQAGQASERLRPVEIAGQGQHAGGTQGGSSLRRGAQGQEPPAIAQQGRDPQADALADGGLEDRLVALDGKVAPAGLDGDGEGHGKREERGARRLD